MLDRITKSLLESETLTKSQAANARFLVSSLIQEAFRLTILPTVQCYTDKACLMNVLRSSSIVHNARLREMVSEEKVKVFWVDGKL